MKKRLSLGELKEYCAYQKIERMLFTSENQRGYRVSNPCKIKMQFTDILISENPCLIYLKSDICTMLLDRVEYVEIDTDESMLGTLLYVVCEGSGRARSTITYTFIAS